MIRSIYPRHARLLRTDEWEVSSLTRRATRTVKFLDPTLVTRDRRRGERRWSGGRLQYVRDRECSGRLDRGAAITPCEEWSDSKLAGRRSTPAERERSPDRLRRALNLESTLRRQATRDRAPQRSSPSCSVSHLSTSARSQPPDLCLRGKRFFFTQRYSVERFTLMILNTSRVLIRSREGSRSPSERAESARFAAVEKKRRGSCIGVASAGRGARPAFFGGFDGRPPVRIQRRTCHRDFRAS